MIPSEKKKKKKKLSSDTTCKTGANLDTLDDVHTLEFLNGMKCSNLPTHCPKLKCEVPVILLRNIDQPFGLCDGTKLIDDHSIRHSCS